MAKWIQVSSLQSSDLTSSRRSIREVATRLGDRQEADSAAWRCRPSLLVMFVLTVSQWLCLIWLQSDPSLYEFQIDFLHYYYVMDDRWSNSSLFSFLMLVATCLNTWYRRGAIFKKESNMEGVIPANNYRSEVKLNAMPWFHGKITRDEAENLLDPREVGNPWWAEELSCWCAHLLRNKCNCCHMTRTGRTVPGTRIDQLSRRLHPLCLLQVQSRTLSGNL